MWPSAPAHAQPTDAPAAELEAVLIRVLELSPPHETPVVVTAAPIPATAHLAPAPAEGALPDPRQRAFVLAVGRLVPVLPREVAVRLGDQAYADSPAEALPYYAAGQGGGVRWAWAARLGGGDLGAVEATDEETRVVLAEAALQSATWDPARALALTDGAESAWGRYVRAWAVYAAGGDAAAFLVSVAADPAAGAVGRAAWVDLEALGLPAYPVCVWPLPDRAIRHRLLEQHFARFREQGKFDRALEVLARYRLDGGSRERWFDMVASLDGADGVVAELAAAYPGGEVPAEERDAVARLLARAGAWAHALGTGDPAPVYAWSLRLREDPDVRWLQAHATARVR